MIVTSMPRPLRAWRALVKPVALLLAWDVGVTLLYFADPTHFDGLEIQFTLFGSAIALFLGFMVNAAYDRWWEARTLWGQVVNSSRSLARQLQVLLRTDLDDAPSDTLTEPGRSAELINATVAYVHLLRVALRQQPMPPEASTYLTPQALARVGGATNKPNAVLNLVAAGVDDAGRQGLIGELSRLQIEATLVALTDAQGGLERIRNTPLPVQYRPGPSRSSSRSSCRSRSSPTSAGPPRSARGW